MMVILTRHSLAESECYPGARHRHLPPADGGCLRSGAVRVVELDGVVVLDPDAEPSDLLRDARPALQSCLRETEGEAPVTIDLKKPALMVTSTPPKVALAGTGAPFTVCSS